MSSQTYSFCAAGLGLALLWHTPLAAANLDQLARDCSAGRTDACSQLASIARSPGDASVRRMAAQRFIQARSRKCGGKAVEPSYWEPRRRIRIASEYFFQPDLDDARQAEIVKAGNEFLTSTFLSLGAEVDSGTDAADAVVEIALFGAAKAWLFGQVMLDGSRQIADTGLDVVMYPDVDWEGAVRVSAGGRCICSQGFRRESQRRQVMYGTSRRKPSEAPFRRDLLSSLAPVLVQLGKELYGNAAVSRLALGADAVQVRETALAQLRDPAVLAEVARKDTSDLLRWTAVGRITNPLVLADAAQRDGSSTVRLAAVQKLSDPAALTAIARQDPDLEVRRQAQARLDKISRAR